MSIAVPERGDGLGARDPARDRDAREGGLDDEPRGTRRSGSARRCRRRRASSPELALLGELGRQLELAARPTRRAVHRRLAAAEPARFPGGWEATAAAAPRRRARGRRPHGAAPPRGRRPAPAPDGLQVVAYRAALLRRPPSSAPSACASCSRARSCSRTPTPSRLGLAEGQQVVVAHAGGRTTGPLRLSRTQRRRRSRPLGRAPVAGAAHGRGSGLACPTGSSSRRSRRSRSSTC